MNLVVLSPNWLGDAVMALPAIADIRRHFAKARLTVAARASVASLFTMVPGVEAVLTLPGRGGLAALRTWRQDVNALASGGFDTAVLLPNSWASAYVVHRAGIAERWGLATDLRARLLTRSAPKPRGAAHQAGYYQALVAALGIANGPAYARVKVPEGTANPITARPYVVLAPGAAYGSAKQWPPARFAELAVTLAKSGQAVVLVGSRADAATCQAISREAGAASPESLIDLSGRTSLAELTAVLAGAAAVVSNDSGAMHLAGAVGAPVVAVFGATNEHRTAPLVNGPDAVPARILATDVWCRPCMLRDCPIDHRCMTGVTADAVASATMAICRRS
jgi:heptosyltransferase-2